MNTNTADMTSALARAIADLVCVNRELEKTLRRADELAIERKQLRAELKTLTEQCTKECA